MFGIFPFGECRDWVPRPVSEFGRKLVDGNRSCGMDLYRHDDGLGNIEAKNPGLVPGILCSFIRFVKYNRQLMGGLVPERPKSAAVGPWPWNSYVFSAWDTILAVVAQSARVFYSAKRSYERTVATIMIWVYYIFFGVLLLFMFAKFIAGARRATAASMLVESQVERLLRIPLHEAQSQAMQIVEERAQTARWERSVGPDVDAKLREIDPASQTLLRHYQKVVFGESGLEFSADFSSLVLFDENFIAVGKSAPQGHILALKPEQPMVYEVQERSVLESYPSIFHLILLTEGLV